MSDSTATWRNGIKAYLKLRDAGDYVSCKPGTKDSIMLAHNQGPWTMPGPLEDYIEHFQAADKAMRQLLAAVDQLSAAVQFCRQNPLGSLLQQGGKWPTQDELRSMAVDAQAKMAPLTMEYGRLSQEFRKYAPNPQSVGIS